MSTTSQLSMLRDQLRKLASHPPKVNAMVGFDGFIDHLQKPVHMRTRDGGIIYFPSIREFAAHLNDLAGKSGQVEIVTQQTKIGGNAPILAESLGALGIPVHCIGSVGAGQPENLFRNMHRLVELHAVTNPGISSALEFSDGKIILSDLVGFAQYDWPLIVSSIGLDKLTSMAAGSRVIALVDWANLPHATNIWKGLLEEVIARIPSHTRRDFFFDLCDPSRKSKQDISEVLTLIGSYSAYGKVTLGVNENELDSLWRSFHGDGPLPGLTEMGHDLFERMGIDSLLVHPINKSILFTRKYNVEMKGRLVKQPKITTGAGDNFNAGYCLGLITGLEPSARLLLGMAASGAYVENGKSPDVDDLIAYTELWMREQNKTRELLPA